MAAATENYGLATGVANDDLIEPGHHNRVADTLDRVLGGFLKRMMADGAYQGWELGTDGMIAAGEGLVNGCWCRTSVAQAVTGLTSNATNYVFAGSDTDSAPAGTVRFFAELSATKPAGAVLLATAVVDAEGQISEVGNAPAGADRNCRRLEIGEAAGEGVVEAVPAGEEAVVTVSHDLSFVVPGAIEVEVDGESFSWDVQGAAGASGFRIVAKNEGTAAADLEYAWRRWGLVG